MQHWTLMAATLAMGCTLLVGCAGGPGYGGNWSQVTDTRWTLISLDGKTPIKQPPVTLTLAADGRAVGHAGVNRYFATYTQDPDGSLRFSAIGATRMAGNDPPGIMDQETRYLSLLDAVRHYRVQEDRLELFTDDGKRLGFAVQP